MAATTTNRALTQYSGDTPSSLFIRDVPDWTKKLRRDDTPFLKLIGREPAPKNPMLKLEWGWGSIDPYTDTGLTGSINTVVTTIPVTNGGMFSVGDTILIDAEWMLVTSISSNNLTVATRPFGGTNASHSSGATVYVGAPAIMENQATPLSPITQGEVDFNYYQQSEFSIQLSHRAAVTPTYETKNFDDRVKAEMRKKMESTAPLRLENSLLFGPRNLGSTTSPSSFGGILTTTTFNTTRTTITGPLTENAVMTNLQTVYGLVGKSRMGLTAMAHPLVLRIISSWYNDSRRTTGTDETIKLQFTKIDTGTFGVITLYDNYMMTKSSTTGPVPLDNLLFFNPEDIKLKPYSGDSGWSIEPLPQNGWFDLMALRGDFTMKAENPDSRLLLSGFSTTEADYPGLA